MENITIKPLCRAFLAREQEHGGYGKGVKRDNAAMEFFVGAANAVKILQDAQGTEFQTLCAWISLVLATRGYKAIADEVGKESVAA